MLAGGYPAFVLASMDTVKSLKGRALRGTFALSIRKTLVIIQFGFSLIVIVATIIIYQQLHFLKNKPLGYDVSYLVQMPHEGNLYLKFDLLRDRLFKSGAIKSISQSSGSVALENNKSVKPEWEGMAAADKSIAFDQIYTTYGFVKTTGIKMISGNDSDFITIRLKNTNNLNASIAKIASITKEINPDFPVDITFVDKLVESKYQDEQTLASIANLFGGLSIFLSCLGLFALSGFSSELRTKEIGIRKVLGANMVNMILLLSIDFLKTVLIAVMLAVITPGFFSISPS